MDSIKKIASNTSAVALQLMGLAYKIKAGGRVNDCQMKMMNALTDTISDNMSMIEKEANSNICMRHRDDAISKRKLASARQEIEDLKKTKQKTQRWLSIERRSRLSFEFCRRQLCLSWQERRWGSRVCIAGGSRVCITGGSRVCIAGGSRVCITGGSRICIAGGSRVCIAGGSRVCIAGGSRVCQGQSKWHFQIGVEVNELTLIFTSTRAKLVEVLAARLYNLQSWRHKAIWLSHLPPIYVHIMYERQLLQGLTLAIENYTPACPCVYIFRLMWYIGRLIVMYSWNPLTRTRLTRISG